MRRNEGQMGLRTTPGDEAAQRQKRHWVRSMLAVWAMVGLATGCSGGTSMSGTTGGSTPAATPTIATAAAQNGAEIVTLSDTTTGAQIYYTTDGSTPTTNSAQYQAPFLVASNITLKAMAMVSGGTASTVATQSFAANIAAGTLVWSDEFTNTTGAPAQPNPTVWGYDTGAGGWGNNELEYYCAWGATGSPCDASNPNAYVGTDGYLHIVARQPSAGVYSSARLKSQGLFSLQYGRLEIRAMVPEAQGLWPAVWLLGNNIKTVNWPACGEQDVLERVGPALTPDWNAGSVHGTGFTGTNLSTKYYFPSGETAAQWHTYGMIWSKGTVAYYIDDPTHPYVTYTTSSISSLGGSVWPFDAGGNFLILNLAVGGQWPGSPDATTPFPSEMLVDYVRVYTN